MSSPSRSPLPPPSPPAVQEAKDIWLIHIVVWQKPTQHCEMIILQIKINFFKIQKKKKLTHQTSEFQNI